MITLVIFSFLVFYTVPEGFFFIFVFHFKITTYSLEKVILEATVQILCSEVRYTLMRKMALEPLNQGKHFKTVKL